MMPILLAYGAEINLGGCLKLAQVMDEMTFRIPHDLRREWKDSRPKKIVMTFENAAAIVRAALAKQTKRHRSLALGVAAQFELTLSQIDVIGQWERITGRALDPDSIVRSNKLWRPGLCYEQFATGNLDLARSKTDVAALFDVIAYPLLMEALASVPETERRGPVVVNEDGLPMFRRLYVDLYKEIADAVGVGGVWNARARHGGITEAHESGADLVDIGKHAQHSDVATTVKHYIVPTVETTRRVAEKRVAHRTKKKDVP